MEETKPKKATILDNVEYTKSFSDALSKQLAISESISKTFGINQEFINSISQASLRVNDVIPQIQMPFGPLFDSTPKITPEALIDDFSKKQQKLIIFEIIPVTKKAQVDNYFMSSNGKSIVFIDEKRFKDSFQKSHSELPVTIPLPKGISNAVVHAVYFFGDYFLLVFEFTLNLTEYNETLSGTELEVLNKRYSVYEDLQKKLETLIPKQLHGLFLNDELGLRDSTLKLPAIYGYNFTEYKAIFEEPESRALIDMGSSTPRGKAETFFHRFDVCESKEDETPKSNYLNHLGIRYQTLFGVIGKKCIVSQMGRYFQDSSKPIPRTYVVLYFEESGLLSFCMELMARYYLFIILERNLLRLKGLVLPKLSEINEFDLEAKKRELLILKSNFDEVCDELLCYFKIFDYFEKSNFRFKDEETWMYTLSRKGWDEYSISDYFAEYLTGNRKEIETIKGHLEKRLRDIRELVETELEIKRDKPVINVLYKDIEDELSQQILKWKDKIPQGNIEAWLSNFETKEERVTALKLLDKMTYVQSNDLKKFIKSAYNKLLVDIGKDDLNGCVISPIGELTSGSVHFMKPFQEENRIPENLFKKIDQLSNETNSKSILILLDDFIGSGHTFVNWYEKNQGLLNKFGVVVYVCAIGFQKGITHIQETTKVKVVSAYILEENATQVKDGTLFKEPIKTEVINLIEKCASRINPDFVWGYEDCQLLFSFEGNIPNNSIGLLWYAKKWTPLLERK